MTPRNGRRTTTPRRRDSIAERTFEFNAHQVVGQQVQALLGNRRPERSAVSVDSLAPELPDYGAKGSQLDRRAFREPVNQLVLDSW
jgi:hypothetical protein